jgi:hypothetical protein
MKEWYNTSSVMGTHTPIVWFQISVISLIKPWNFRFSLHVFVVCANVTIVSNVPHDICWFTMRFLDLEVKSLFMSYIFPIARSLLAFRQL